MLSPSVTKDSWEQCGKSDWGFDVPVFSRLLLKDHVAVVHPVLCGDVDLCVGVVVSRLFQHVVHNAFPVLPHVPERPPHDVDRVVAVSEEVLRLLQNERDAGVGHDPQRCLEAHVVFESPGWCVVHAPDAGRAVDLRAEPLSQHLPRAGHDAAELTVKLQRLKQKKETSQSELQKITVPMGFLRLHVYFQPIIKWQEVR